MINFAPVAQLDRVTDYESGGRRFESSRAHQSAYEGRLRCQLAVAMRVTYQHIRSTYSPLASYHPLPQKPSGIYFLEDSNIVVSLRVCCRSGTNVYNPLAAPWSLPKHSRRLRKFVWREIGRASCRERV